MAPHLAAMIRWSIACSPLLAISAGSRAGRPQRPLVLAFGDSLTAGYGLDQGLGFAPQLQATLRRHGIAATVADGGVSGDTSQAGRARLGWTLDGLARKPDLVIVELGANDMLRGLDPALTERNLDAILAELEPPPNPGPARRHARRAQPRPGLYRVGSRRSIPSSPRKHRRDALPLLPRRRGGAAGHESRPTAMHPTFAGVKTDRHRGSRRR